MDGSIRERLNSKGKKIYDVTYRITDFKTGERKQKLKRGFKRKGDAQEFLNEILGQIKSHTYVQPQKITVKNLLDEWFVKFVEGKLAANTVAGYSVNLYKHVIPNIGGIVLQNLKAKNIQDFYSEIGKNDGNNGAGLSARSIVYIHRNLSKALDYAMKEKYVFNNPAKDVILPSGEKFRGKAYDNFTLMQLLQSVKNSVMELPIALGGLSGLRRGEIAGIKWEDIDFKNNILNIRKQRTTKTTGEERSKVKTSDSYRSIRASATLMEIIKRHKEIQQSNKNIMGDQYTDSGFVCQESDGSIIKASLFSKRFASTLKEHSFEHIRMHDLRHSYASSMLRLGIPVTTVSTMLGHSSATVTLDVYGHCLDKMQVEAVVKQDADLARNMEEIIDTPQNN